MVALIAAKIAADLARQGIGIITKKIAEKNAAKAAIKVAQLLFPMGDKTMTNYKWGYYPGKYGRLNTYTNTRNSGYALSGGQLLGGLGIGLVVLTVAPFVIGALIYKAVKKC